MSKMYECKMCGHVSEGGSYETAAKKHREHFAANHHDGNMYLWSALPRRVVKP